MSRQHQKVYALGMGLAATLLLFPAAQAAETGLPANNEMRGLESILGVIGNTSLHQNDFKLQQSVLDILDMKEQLYTNAIEKPGMERAPRASTTADGKRVPPPKRMPHRRAL